ncbi:hypothetical protein JW926_02240 [Candidatus Sumerlaeota bacterium]|nr:hypothetical protein [Candidatus Sumerlaeota bacterium]
MIDEQEKTNRARDACDYSIPNLRIQLVDPPEPFAMIIKSAQKQDWTPFHPSPYLVKEKKETVILYQGSYYRLLEAKETPTGWIYRLNPLPQGEIPFNIVPLDIDQWARGVIDRDDTERLKQKTRKAWLYEGFIGWLPGKIQQELAERWEFNPEDASKKNAIFQAAIFFIFTMATLGSKFAILMAWFSLWGMLRWFHVYISETGCGFFTLEIIFHLVTENRVAKK